MDNLSQRIAGLSPAKRALLELRLQQTGASVKREPIIKPRANRGWARASFAQQRLWFLDQLEPGQASYNVPRAMHLRGALNVKALQATLAEIVRRHEVFRTHFSDVDGDLRQITRDEVEIPLTVIDLARVPEAERETHAAQLAKEEAARPFNLNTGPVIRTTLLRLSDEEHILLLTTHHIVSDAWSSAILFRELGELYEAFANGTATTLAPLTVQYADFAEWQRDWLQGETLEEQLSYWKQQLEGVTGVLALPLDYPRPAAPTFQGAYKSLALSPRLSSQLVDLSKREGATVFMTLLAAFQTLLYRCTGEEDFVVGSPIAGRNRGEIEDLIGFFVNTLALRADLSGNPTFRQLLQRVKETAIGAYAHQDLPFEKLVEELDPERDLGRNPLFQVMFQYQEATEPRFQSQDLKLSWLETSTDAAKFDLTLAVVAEAESLNCFIEYSTDIFKGETIERLLGHYAMLLEGIVSNPNESIGTLVLMTETERREVITVGRGEVAAFPREQDIQDLFEQQVERTPNEVALVFGNERLNYRELNARANQLAHYLREQGVGPEMRVAIRVERSPEMTIGLLGILKAGGAYVPLEPSYPEERTAFMLEDSGASLLLTQERLIDSLPAARVLTVCLDRDWREISRQSDANPTHETTAENAAHVIYTSGSTGRPKGVVSAHRASVNRFAWMWRAYPFAAGEVCCQKTSLGFVDSIWEIFGPLLRGVPLVIIDDESLKDPIRFVETLATHKVSRLVLVPSLLRVILESNEDLATRLTGLRYCVCSGETLPVELANAFREKLPYTTLINLYGSSEVAADVTCYEVTGGDRLGSVPIGRPIANTQIYILDPKLQPVPLGVAGEIYVGGEGLARGYLNQPALTAEKFIANPFNGGESKLFRTGDLGRYLTDGNIEYHGRCDHQVKVRGFRIELGEIEAALKTHPAILQTVVIARDDARSEKQLVAYLVAKETMPAIDELRAFLRRKLPDYMVPSAFLALESLPLTASGKVDRLALPTPDQNQIEARETFIAPRTPTEDVLATIWAETLGLARVGVNDDFFALGGHSLLVARIVARVREALRIELPLRTLFDASTVSALAREVDRLRQAGEGLTQVPLVPVPRDEPLPLSFGQERLWFFDQLEPGSAAYNIPRALRIKGPLDKKALQQSLNAIIARHEVLRTSFVNVNGRPELSIAENATIEIPCLDSRQVPPAEREERARALATEEVRHPFDLTRAPMLRLLLIEFDDEDHLLLLTIHHIVTDGWSFGVIRRELAALYNAYFDKSRASLPDLTVQYADFALWQRQSFAGEPLKKQLDYWREQLASTPAVINLPSDRPRPAVRSFRGARHAVKISEEIADKLRELGRSERATLFMTVLTAFQLLLACITGDEDIVVGSPTAGRSRSETEGLIGYFVNTILLRARLSQDPTFRAGLRQARDVALGAFTNQDVPFDKLVDELEPERSLSHNPLFQVWFALQNAPAEGEDLRGLTIDSLDVDSAATRHDLQLTLWGTADGLEGAFTFSTDLFDSETIAQIEKQFQALLVTIIAQPESCLSALRPRLADVAREYRAELAQRIEESSRKKLKSIRRKVVSKVEPEIAEEEAWTSPTQ
jgi:amino acid adenylation domain-containing protein